jgi:hypothetical protein
MTRTAAEWSAELGPWNNIVEAGRTLFGEQWAFHYLSAIAAAIRSTSDKCRDSGQLLDPQRPLCRRARYARLRPTSAKWWNSRLGSAADPIQLLFVLLMAFTWAAPQTIVANIELLESKLSRLDEKQ